MKSLCRWLLPALLLGPVAGVSAQPAAPSRPDPLDAASAVPRVEYRSSFADYRRHADQPVGSWRAANETVTRIGGWRAYAREAEDAAPPAAAPASTARGNAAHGSGQHGKEQHGDQQNGNQQNGNQQHGSKQHGQKEHGHKEHGHRHHGASGHGMHSRGHGAPRAP